MIKNYIVKTNNSFRCTKMGIFELLFTGKECSEEEGLVKLIMFDAGLCCQNHGWACTNFECISNQGHTMGHYRNVNDAREYLQIKLDREGYDITWYIHSDTLNMDNGIKLHETKRTYEPFNSDNEILSEE